MQLCCWTVVPHRSHCQSSPSYMAKSPQLLLAPQHYSVFCLYEFEHNLHFLTDDITGSVHVFFMLVCMQVHACMHGLKAQSTSCFNTGSPTSPKLSHLARAAGQQTPGLFPSFLPSARILSVGHHTRIFLLFCFAF